MPKLVVFGGRGFVGSHILQEALNTGLHVISVSRSGGTCTMIWSVVRCTAAPVPWFSTITVYLNTTELVS